ncbi:MAG TPA: DUF6125 family protein [Syntrophales bacterium]|nr:DUF6125 family protein [Syntrophales bacterium]
MAAEHILKRFKIKEKGLRAFVEAQKPFPWAMIIGYEIDQEIDEVIISVPRCSRQESMIAKGLPEFSCRKTHCSKFENLAKIIDNRITTQCLFAPPDKHPDYTFCRWRFTIEDQY